MLVSLILALRRPRQEISYKLKASLGLQSEFQASSGYLGRPCFKKKKEESKRGRKGKRKKEGRASF